MSRRAPLRGAVIGHTGRGDYGHGLDVVMAGLSEIDVVAVADPNEAGRSTALRASGAKVAYADYREMLEREQLDLVAIAPRWLDQRLDMVTAAAAAGVHIFLEKPMASDLACADKIISACQEGGVKLAVAHLGRLHPTNLYARKMVENGAIGRLRIVRGFGKMDHRGGLEDLLVLGSHVVDTMRSFAGDAHWVSGDLLRGSRLVTIEDAREATERVGPVAGNGLRASCGFDNDVVGMIESFVGLGGHNEFFGVDLVGEEGQLSLRGDHVKRLWRHPRPYDFPGVDHWTEVDLPPGAADKPRRGEPGTGHHRGNQRVLVDLLHAIIEDRPPLSSGANARESLEIIQAVAVAHFAGGRVSVPVAERTHPLSMA